MDHGLDPGVSELGHQELAGLCHAAQTGSRVDGVSDGRVLQGALAADSARHDGSCVDADADLDLVLPFG